MAAKITKQKADKEADDTRVRLTTPVLTDGASHNKGRDKATVPPDAIKWEAYGTPTFIGRLAKNLKIRSNLRFLLPVHSKYSRQKNELKYMGM